MACSETGHASAGVDDYECKDDSVVLQMKTWLGFVVGLGPNQTWIETPEGMDWKLVAQFGSNEDYHDTAIFDICTSDPYKGIRQLRLAQTYLPHMASVLSKCEDRLRAILSVA